MKICTPCESCAVSRGKVSSVNRIDDDDDNEQDDRYGDHDAVQPFHERLTPLNGKQVLAFPPAGTIVAMVVMMVVMMMMLFFFL